MADTTREQNLEELRRREIERHEKLLVILARAHQRELEGEEGSHAIAMDRIQRALAGENVHGICPACGRDYRTFHQWDEYEQCPRCGADLSGGSES